MCAAKFYNKEDLLLLAGYSKTYLQMYLLAINEEFQGQVSYGPEPEAEPLL